MLMASGYMSCVKWLTEFLLVLKIRYLRHLMLAICNAMISNICVCSNTHIHIDIPIHTLTHTHTHSNTHTLTLTFTLTFTLTLIYVYKLVILVHIYISIDSVYISSILLLVCIFSA